MSLSCVKPWVILLGCWVLFIWDCSRAEGGDWTLYHQTDEAFYFYDVESITKFPTTLKISEKSVVRQTKPCTLAKAVREVSETRNRSPREMTDESCKKAVAALCLQETRRLYEIQCQAKMYRIITGMEYDKEETLIEGILSSKWGRIKPNSSVERLYKAVCP